jgi:integrase
MDHEGQNPMKKELKERTLIGLKSKHTAKHYDVMDTLVRGFGVRVMAAPSKALTFILRKRYPGNPNPVRRSIGSFPEMTLAEAREKAREWSALVKKDKDPAEEMEARRKETAEAKRRLEANTFKLALAEYVRHVAKLKSGHRMARVLRRDFEKIWAEKPLTEITREDVEGAIQTIIDRGAEAQAHTSLALLGTFFNWCVDRRKIETAPHQRIKPIRFIGKMKPRSRVLKDAELAAYWKAAGDIDYPFGPFYRLLALTALRRAEVSDAKWSEIDFKAGLWTIPPERMKGGAAHTVPLVPEIAAILKSLPRFQGGPFVFSTTGGRRPILGFSKVKLRLDATMKAELGERFESYRLHDVRRTVRTRLSALPVQNIVRELLLAHAQPGMEAVYDQHLYNKEKRQALGLWHKLLRKIVEPKPPRKMTAKKSANLVQLHEKRERLGAVG